MPGFLPDAPVKMSVAYNILEELGEQQIHVTLKDAGSRRLDRKVHTIKGKGGLKVAFDVPAAQLGSAVRFAAFVGKDYPHHLQHIISGPIPVERTADRTP